eukprot:27608-Pelagococcus_subviridis.AAC.2
MKEVALASSSVLGLLPRPREHPAVAAALAVLPVTGRRLTALVVRELRVSLLVLRRHVLPAVAAAEGRSIQANVGVEFIGVRWS